MITRRRVLLGGGAVGALALGGGALALRLPAPAPGALILSTRELAIVASIGEVMFPGGTFPIDGAHPAVAAEVDRVVGDTFDALRGRGFRYVLRAVEYGAIVRHGRPFSALPFAERLEIVRTWSDPEILTRRVAWDSVRVVLGMAFFAQPEVTTAMGWRALCGGGGR